MTYSKDKKLLVKKEHGELLEILFKKNEGFKKAESELLYILDSLPEPLQLEDLYTNYFLGTIYLGMQSHEKADQRFKKVVQTKTTADLTDIYKLITLIIGVYSGRCRTEEDNYWEAEKVCFEKNLFQI
jgi:hypothetical protein